MVAIKSIKQHLELITGVAVIVSLLIVAYEIRQSTNALAAQGVYDLNESARQTLLLQATDEELSMLILKARHDRESMTDLEWLQYSRFVWSLTNMYESAWTFQDRGLIPVFRRFAQ